jgi:hypothetical protein
MIATIAAAVLVEWAVTLRERIASGGGGVVAKAAGVLREVTLLRTGERRRRYAERTSRLMPGVR